MRGIAVRLGLAAMAVASICGFGSHQADALSVTFGFEGFVTSLTDPTNITGVNLHDHITGSITFDPVISNDPDVDVGFAKQYNETGSFTFSGPSTGPFTVSGASASPAIDSAALFGGSSIVLSLGVDGDNEISLAFGNPGGGTLAHLSDLPSDALSLASLLGAGYSGNGSLFYQGAFVGFNIVTPTAAPIPGAVWLFASALGGVGLLGWARRRALPMAAA